jgi:hypothetical protein
MVLECFGNTYATDSQKSWSTGNELAQKFDEIEEHFFTKPRLKQCFFAKRTYFCKIELEFTGSIIFITSFWT